MSCAPGQRYPQLSVPPEHTYARASRHLPVLARAEHNVVCFLRRRGVVMPWGAGAARCREGYARGQGGGGAGREAMQRRGGGRNEIPEGSSRRRRAGHRQSASRRCEEGPGGGHAGT